MKSAIRVEKRCRILPGSNRNPLDDVAGDLFLAAVVEASGAGIGVASQALHVFEGDALFQKVGDGCYPEGVRPQSARQRIKGTPASRARHRITVRANQPAWDAWPACRIVSAASTMC